MKNNIDYQKLYKKSEFINLISGFEYTTVELNEDNKYVIVDKETNSELADEAGEFIICDYGNVLISEENLETPLTSEFETNINNAIKGNKAIEAF
ncbi:hypothetical protein R2F61_06995 [Mollicutes bacterium LVI A0078]|nr:hypothetical protein RZE84_07000 [Mollicutes bacterium LVI A0075]WOO90470.1 hypothetical protein R2F61_06995 [Mollicutes bacterium LVI A0078]